MLYGAVKDNFRFLYNLTVSHVSLVDSSKMPSNISKYADIMILVAPFTNMD